MFDFDKLFEKEYGIIIKEESLIEATRLFNHYGVKNYRFVEINAGCENGSWFVGFSTNKWNFAKIIRQLNIQAVTHK